MGAAKDIIAPYVQGRRDCEAGINQQSQDPDYMQGYGEQYALEQAATSQSDQMMEKYCGNYKA